MFEKCIVKDKLDNLEKKLDTLVNKDDFESFKKEFEDFKEDYLMRNDQKYLLKKIKSYILENCDKIKLKYTKNEDSYVSEEWVYKDDNISIIKTKMKTSLLSYCSLTIDYTPIRYFNSSFNYSVEYKGVNLENCCNAKEVFDKLEEYKKSA